MIQMIVMDMDGTLLTSDNRISSRTKELLLRVRALLRRANIEMERKLTIGNLVLDADAVTAVVDETEIAMTTREFNILYKLLSYPNKTFSRGQLMDEVWGMDYFGDDYLIIVDESHKTIPQIRGMYAGDRSRKSTLVDYGFRLPSALDNRPLNFEEFESKIDQIMFVSATPGDYEANHELLRAEQIIRPTGLLDPMVEVRPVEGQIDDLVGEVNKEVEKGNKILITTLTKRMAEDLTDYMKELGIRVKYLHSDIDTLERTEIIRDMRLNVFDVLVGINLLREGLDIPEITLVAILDADKEGFLRSETSLIQTIGRAARNSDGRVIMYGDTITDSMRLAIDETMRRRKLQQEYNEAHGITPQTIKKAVRDLISISKSVAETEKKLIKDPESMNKKELQKLIKDVEKQMRAAAADLNFEMAAELRDKMIELRKNLEEISEN